MARREAARVLLRAAQGAARRAPAAVPGASNGLLQQIAVPMSRGLATLPAATSAGAKTFLPVAAAAAAAACTAGEHASNTSAFHGAVPSCCFAVAGLATVVSAGELERTFIAIKPDGVQRGLISEIVERFERKGYKLVGLKLVQPSKTFAEQHYHDLKGRPFFNGLTDFLSSGPVVAMVWEGPGVIAYGRKMIGATNPQASEPGTIRGDLAVVVGRNIIHGSDGPETAKNEIALWFTPSELISYNLDAHKWIYE